MLELLTFENLAALAALAGLEIVLGIDNIVFIAIITSKLPEAIQPKIRRIGLILAMVQRLLLLLVLSWLARLTDPLFEVWAHPVSGRDLILFFGGLFLLGKATFEIHGTMEGHHLEEDAKEKAAVSVASVLIQITILDAVFSLDSVITAVGMVDHLAIMVVAIILAVMVMMLFANPVSDFILKHPTVKMLALSFLVLIGFVLIMDGAGQHVEKGYIYFAMGFSIFVELLNLKMRGKRSKKELKLSKHRTY